MAKRNHHVHFAYLPFHYVCRIRFAEIHTTFTLFIPCITIQITDVTQTNVLFYNLSIQSVTSGRVVWSGSMDVDEERRTSSADFLKGKYLEEYMVLNMKMGNGKVGRIEN